MSIEAMKQALKPCPFCGAGITEIREKGKLWTGRGWSQPSSVSVFHWCEEIKGQPSRAIERVGKDLDSAVKAWNLRQAIAEAEKQEPVAWQKDAVFDASIEFIKTLTGMQPPPIEIAPPEVFAPFRQFADKVCAIFSAYPPKRVPLTDEQLREIENKINPNMRWRSSDEEGITLYPIEYYDLVRAIEAAHGIKGGA